MNRKTILRLLLALLFVLPMSLGQAHAATITVPSSSGGHVRDLQYRLYSKGYFTYKLTGFYGSLTQSAPEGFGLAHKRFPLEIIYLPDND